MIRRLINEGIKRYLNDRLNYWERKRKVGINERKINTRKRYKR